MNADVRDDERGERRRETRTRVFKGGTLSFNKGYGALQCQVRNQSANGARLSFGETSAVPSSFDLLLSDAKAPRRAQVRWRTMTAIGVSLGD